MTARHSLVSSLFDIGIIKFGEFKLKSGVDSPFYIDLRPLVSYPKLLNQLAELLWEKIEVMDSRFICGVPYSAISFASAVSVNYDKPMLTKRKERKKYGTKKQIEGDFVANDRVVLIEDVVSSGASLLETIEVCENEGLVVEGCVVVIDRQQGGVNVLREKGLKVEALFDVAELLDLLVESDRIDVETANKVKHFVDTHQITTPRQARKQFRYNYSQKQEAALHPSTSRLLNIIQSKKTNLICSADVSTKAELLKLADQVGPHICALKTHIDIVHDFDKDLIRQLQSLSDKHNFLLFEDRKFSDIGNTVRLQFESEHYNIPDWAHMLTVHLTAGQSVVEALEASNRLDKTALVGIVGLSTSDTLTDKGYIQRALEIVLNKKHRFAAIVAQQDLLGEEAGIMQFTPGINLAAKGDAHGQQYNSPEHAFATKGTDVIIVGRGIYQSDNPAEAAANYKQAGWHAYEKSMEVMV